MEDRRVPAAFTVSSAADGGPGSLRQAILDANAAAGADTIGFNLGTSGVQTITLSSPLPAITDPVTIDATTEPGFDTSTHEPLVVLDGSGIPLVPGPLIDGLDIKAGQSTVEGLAIRGFPHSGILLEAKGGNVIRGNVLGLEAAGTTAKGNGVGIIDTVGNNTIGGTTAADRNVISGNSVAGVMISGGNDLVQGNYIGTDATGTKPLGNGVGIILDGPSNTVGGAVAGARNLISGNTGAGITVGDPLLAHDIPGNVVAGNLIGTDVTGMKALGNGRDGIAVGAAATRIGGLTSAEGNLISANGGNGITIGVTFADRAAGVTVVGNFIGIDLAGGAALGNAGAGVAILGAVQAQIGSPQSGGRNVISANQGPGVLFDQSGSFLPSNNLVQGNYIGVDTTGTKALGNGGSGVEFRALSGGNTIGGGAAGDSNVISANGGDGIALVKASFNQVQGNVIGTDVTGAVALGNAGVGVRVTGGFGGNLIGGSAAGQGNLISGNKSGGIDLGPSDLTTANGGNVVQGNFIGTDLAGRARLGNGGFGLLVTGAQNVIGGTTAAARNLISASGLAGVAIVNARGNVLLGNFIGTDVSGTRGLGNSGAGVFLVSAPGSIVGGAAAGLGNVIAANGGGGLVVASLPGSDSSGTLIQGNFIGTDATGTVALANQGVGVLAQSGGVILGGTNAAAGNLISGNAGPGVVVLNGAAAPVAVLGNLIGTDDTGAKPLGNAGVGIYVDGRGNLIGGALPGAGNTVAFNAGPGVVVAAGSAASPDVGNAILSDFLFGNGGPGLALAPGANGNPPAPVISAAPAGNGMTTLKGTLHATPNTPYLIQFFLADRPNEGRVLIGTIGAVTDASGLASFSALTPAQVGTGQLVTATATDAAGNTSAFSNQITPPPAPTVKSVQRVGGSVVLSFSGDLDPASAQNPAVYTLVTSGRDRRIGTPDDAIIPLSRATYDSGRRTVTLTPARTLPAGPAAVLINIPGAPPLLNPFGDALDGDNNGTPGGLFVAILS
jgi:hypothetical protein